MRAALVVALLPMWVVSACDDAPEAEVSSDQVRPTGKADGAAPISEIRFDSAFTAPVATPALIAGGSVAVDYDTQRFYEIYDGEGWLGYFDSSFHCYGYGCCEVEFPEVVEHHRWDGGEVASQSLDEGTASFEVPTDASSLEMWFSAPGFEIRTWYCGCEAACSEANRAAAQPRWIDREVWDSRYEQNYELEVGGWPVVFGEDVKLIAARVDEGVFSGEIEVRDLGWQKDVQVHWTVVDADGAEGEWRGSDAAFAGMSEGGELERWSFTIADAAVASGDVRFAISFASEGTERWDNNCGWNYQAGPGDGVVGHVCE